jgi:V/A-type H+-transporting ATPase subunit I
MIVRMSKVEIVGAKELLQEALTLLREMGIFQIEPATVGFIEEGREEDIRSFIPDEKSMFERLFLESLRQKIDELFSFLPKHPVRESYLEPRSIIDTIAKTIERHISLSKELFEKRDALKKERDELDRYAIFLGALASLVETTKETPDLDFIGLTIREPEMVDHLREAISRITDWKFELMTETAQDGTLVGLITVEKDLADKVKKSLSDEHVPELIFPSSFSALTFSEKVVFVKNRILETTAEIEHIDAELGRLAQRWIPIYQSVKAWIDDRLSLLSTTTATFETRMCFFINGWMPTSDLERLRRKVTETYGSKVVVAEKEMREEDLERVPIVLKNPPYFKPFEIFTSILPLPSYTSYDPTPFIGIFFPIFFGMILGDAGYGVLLGIISYFLMKKFRKTGMVRDGAKILMIASLYTTFFGVLFGEFFGDLPERFFHLKPLLVERREAVVPMIYFALSVGVAHVLLGLVLGAITGFKHGEKKEATYKILSVVVILAMIAVLASFFGVFPALFNRPIVIGILFLTPVLFFTGGLLAPLELLKSIGNIISYVRIMAIGLTSVLLAFVANRLGGETGDIFTGVIVAGLLHLLNIILGVFSPTIHSLRLHYVEFFSKFMEHGGRRFEPLKK